MKKILSVFMFFCMCFSCSNLLFGQVAPTQLPLNPNTIPKYVDPLPHFAGLRVDAKAGGDLTVKAVPHTQVAVSTGTVLANGVVGTTAGAGVGNYWVYQISKDGGANYTPPLWPAFTIEASRGHALNVEYVNALIGQKYEDVNLVLDQTLHWADPMGDHGSMAAYTGDVPIVPHLHGGEVASESDGGPDAWFTPGYAITGPSWGMDGTDEMYDYPNTQEGATLWFHDHALGATRLNVYAGMAAFYLLRETDEDNLHLPGWSGDDLVREVAPTGASGIFNPNPYLPEIEIVFQDRMFDTNGQLYFPNLPSNLIHPFWTPEFIGDVITVNGKTWPYLSVAPRKYRFRLLNGSNARFYELKLTDLVTGMVGPVITQIGTDGGFLDAPVPVTAMGNKLIMAPGERADVIIDFSASTSGQVWTLTNSARTPYPKGGNVNPNTTGQVMQFVVNGEMVSAADNTQPGIDNSALPASLRPSPMVKLSNFAGGIATGVTPTVTRQLTLNEVMDAIGPLEALVNNTKWDGDGMEIPGLGITELPVEGETEIWQIINLTGDAHPIHLHLVQFQLVGRQAYNTNKYGKEYANAFGGTVLDTQGPPNDYNLANADGALGGNPAISGFLQGKIDPPNPNEMGWKDTYIVYPGEVTTFVVRFAPTDVAVDADPTELMFGFDPSEGPGYVWHCHIIDHEDNEMMRPYIVEPSPLRAPAIAGAGLKSGTITASKIVDADLGFNLEQNYPNPGKYETEIRFQVPETMHVRLTIYNQLGQEVKVLLNNQVPKGNNKVLFNREGLTSGIYVYRLQAGSNVATKKMILQ